ncbi:unnamed protein product [Acanthosepion pharaonis]|uniref:Uncharacterized protein n=1 Tax=Acanthosepion pharaonis TaxID=158019 RepID=A0A812CDT9_ACAPH|nr:unnamed protein product [Sepia pharaonis]
MTKILILSFSLSSYIFSIYLSFFFIYIFFFSFNNHYFSHLFSFQSALSDAPPTLLIAYSPSLAFLFLPLLLCIAPPHSVSLLLPMPTLVFSVTSCSDCNPDPSNAPVDRPPSSSDQFFLSSSSHPFSSDNKNKLRMFSCSLSLSLSLSNIRTKVSLKQYIFFYPPPTIAFLSFFVSLRTITCISTYKLFFLFQYTPILTLCLAPLFFYLCLFLLFL